MTKLTKYTAADLVEKTSSNVLAGYLLRLREIFETNDQIKSIVVNSEPASAAKSKLLKLLTNEYKSNSKDRFEQALNIILDELDDLRQKSSSMYLIDKSTGMPIMPITEDLIYTPQDYTGEDGKLHKSKPMLHPGVASSLALHTSSKAKLQKHLSKAKDPTSEQAYKHLSEPEQILEIVKEKLTCMGVEITSTTDKCDKVIEFGREQVEGIMQSPNIRFHRTHMFAAILVNKILKLGGKSSKYSVGPVKNKETSKQTWYTMEVDVS